MPEPRPLEIADAFRGVSRLGDQQSISRRQLWQAQNFWAPGRRLAGAWPRRGWGRPGSTAARSAAVWAGTLPDIIRLGGPLARSRPSTWPAGISSITGRMRL